MIFYEIIDENYLDRRNEFLIDSEILRKWLNIRNRQKFNNTIKRSYIKNIDYKTDDIRRNKGKGSSFQVIKLTPDATKLICQATKSKKGILVWKYFVEIEYILHKYKNYIIDGLNNKIKKLENNQKPNINENSQIIYVFKALNTDLTLYKIGRTTDLKNRLKSYNSALANDLEIIFQFETNNVKRVESCIKNYMKKAQYRKYKEVYQIDIDLLKQFIKDCHDDIASADRKITNSQKGGSNLLFMFIPNKKYNYNDN
jgi:phage anti-repressor protein